MAKRTKRDDEISKRPAIKKKLLDAFKDIDRGFADQRNRSDDILDFWDIYNCKLGSKQFYSGNAKIFVPIVKNAIKARRTRFANQIFPQSGRFVEVTTPDADIPHATMSLLEHYVRKTKLRTRVVPALLVSGDVEGHMHLYCGWEAKQRKIVSRETKPVQIDGMDYPEHGEVEDIKEEDCEDAGPTVEVLADADVLILPVTASSVDDAIEKGGSVTVIRRWTKAQIKRMVDEGQFVEGEADALIEELAGSNTKSAKIDPSKVHADAAGIKMGGGGRHVLGYETWMKLKVDGEMRLCRIYYGGNEQILGAKLNPYWCDEVPMISAPVEEVQGVFKGRSQVADVADLQVQANDAVNEGADTAHFSAMPIVMTDPEKNPRVGTMVLGLAAVWETSPQSTQFAQFPKLWMDCLEIVANVKNEIFQTLGVNPAMMPQQTGKAGQKRNQAEIANEQQVDLLTTADAVTVIEEGIMSPLLQRFAAYDHQFRDDDLIVRKFGEMGHRAIMEAVPPISFSTKYEFRWFGVEAARNAAQMQQQIAGINMLKQIPPQAMQGYRMDLTPAITQMVENLFGPRLAPLIFQDMKMQLAVDPALENQMLESGFDVMVHMLDEDAKHIQAHMPLMQGGDPTGAVRKHIMLHQQQMQAKQMQQMGGGPPKGANGSGGTPSGAQPSGRVGKGPPGAINADRMAAAGAPGMPRKM